MKLILEIEKHLVVKDGKATLKTVTLEIDATKLKLQKTSDNEARLIYPIAGEDILVVATFPVCIVPAPEAQ